MVFYLIEYYLTVATYWSIYDHSLSLPIMRSSQTVFVACMTTLVTTGFTAMACGCDLSPTEGHL
jgi:hypothetical protein